jgi:DNA-binding SARP family transcriptional activator
MTQTTTEVFTELNLLDRLELRCGGDPVCLPDASQRLLAFLALRDRYQHRNTVAGTLWIDTTEDRAAANLRTALWRLRKLGSHLVDCDGSFLRIGGGIRIDLAGLVASARTLLERPDSREEPGTTTAALGKELLPEWDDDWVVLERERLRQIRLHGLEALCRRLAALGRHALAIEAAQTAVSMEPLRETAQRALIVAHLGEGNFSEAVRQYEAYCVLLRDNLGVGPSQALRVILAQRR